jgi:hypothetical protein
MAAAVADFTPKGGSQEKKLSESLFVMKSTYREVKYRLATVMFGLLQEQSVFP